jgi:MFS family permease
MERRTITTIAALGLAGATTGLMHTGVVPLLPEFPELLGVSLSDAAWVATVALVAGGVATPIVGKIGDLYGARRVLLGLLWLGLAGSLLAAVANSFPLLLVARALQGPAVAAIPLTLSISRHAFDRRHFPVAVAALSAIALGVGTGFGPLTMGVVVDHWGWRSVFWISVVMSALSLVFVMMVVPKVPTSPAPRFDAVGALVLAAVLVALLLTMSRGSHWGWASPGIVGLGVTTVLGAVVWVRLQQRAAHPLVDLASMRSRPLGLTHAAGFVIGSTMFAHYVATYSLMVLPDEAGYGLGLTVGRASLIQLPAAFVLVVAAGVGTVIVRRAGSAVLLVSGNATLAAGFISLTALHGEPWQVLMGSSIVYVGIGLSYSSLPLMLGRYVPISSTASVNSLNALWRTIGSVFATAAVTATLASSVVGHSGRPSHTAFRAVYLACAGIAGWVAWQLTRLPQPEPSPQIAV